MKDAWSHAKLVRRLEEDDFRRAVIERLKAFEVVGGQGQLKGWLRSKQVGGQHALVELDAQLASSEDGRAREAIRALVEQIVVQPGSARGGKRWLMQFCVGRCSGCWRPRQASNADSPCLFRGGAVQVGCGDRI
jgi:hypothetical protein